MNASGGPRSCGELLVALLEERGVEVVFGIPGVHTLELYRGLSRSSIRHVLPRHEQGAAFMADGYARVSRRPGVCFLITGAGVTNAATAVASAYHDSQPVLIISSATDSRREGRLRGTLHELPDQERLMRTITGSSETVRSPTQLRGAVKRAFAVLEGPRPRPAHIGIPIDVLSAPAPAPAALAASTGSSPHAPGLAGSVRPAAQPQSLDAAASLLAGASRPLIVLGGGAIDAGEQALRVSSLTGAPIATTVNGKGAIPETHPAALGATLTLEPVYGALQTADVVLAVGTELSEVDYYYQDDIPRFDGALIRVDTDPSQVLAGRDPAVAIVGDARGVLTGLVDRLNGGGDTADRGEAAALRVLELRAELQWWPGAAELFPVLDAIAGAVPADAIITADSSQLAYVANCSLSVTRPRSYLSPSGFGTLGPALPMAIGAQLAAPQRSSVCLIGDGGLLFTVAELATAASLETPLVVLVWNNHGYGEIRDEMDRGAIPHIGTDGGAPDYTKIAEGLGCEAARVTSIQGIGPAIRTALDSGRPTLVELSAAMA
jgi:acetolactate synthase-1/2/3 large subunit